MVRLSFAFDGDCPAQVPQAHAYFLIDGPLEIWADGRLFFHEVVPLIELAVWLSQWLAADRLTTPPTESFCPEAFDEELFHLHPQPDSRYTLSYQDEGLTHCLTADYAAFAQGFGQFVADLDHALRERYHIRLAPILQPFLTP